MLSNALWMFSLCDKWKATNTVTIKRHPFPVSSPPPSPSPNSSILFVASFLHRCHISGQESGTTEASVVVNQGEQVLQADHCVPQPAVSSMTDSGSRIIIHERRPWRCGRIFVRCYAGYSRPDITDNRRWISRIDKYQLLILTMDTQRWKSQKHRCADSDIMMEYGYHYVQISVENTMDMAGQDVRETDELCGLTNW